MKKIKGYINKEGDFVTDYIVEMGRVNDLKPRITMEITAKCDYMAAQIAERIRPGYIVFKVYSR